MIHVATVHWLDPKWISPQRRGLAAHVDEPFRVVANLEGIGAAYDEYFDQVVRTGGPHPDKLNSLADVVSCHAAPEDLLVFLDGDAFPVRPIGPWLRDLLSVHPLAAVRRDENAGDLQPHPCFCVTTVGFWNEIGGDWRAGTWVTSEGLEASDVGGRLLATLRARSAPWRPILRSNQVDLHPVLYGVYERRVYHHGAGFRPPIARADEAHVPVADNEEYLYLRTRMRAKSFLDLRPRHLPRLARLTRDGVRSRSLNAYMRRESRRSAELYQQICADPEFYRQFEGTGAASPRAVAP